MILFIFFLAFCFSLIFTLLTLRTKTASDKFIILSLYYLFLTLSIGILISQLLGLTWPIYCQISTFVFILVYWMRQIWIATFWGKLLYGTSLVIHLCLGGYIYAITQLPYDNAPFKQISSNGPLDIHINQLSTLQITGLPNNNASSKTIEHIKPRPLKPINQTKKPDVENLSWANIEVIMHNDSRIHSVLQTLKEEQNQALSDRLAHLNTLSTSSTQMAREALNTAQTQQLIAEKAMSNTHYKTLKETWNLLNQDEQAFKNQQQNERFQTLLSLLEDNLVDETYKVDFIRFMSKNFADDTRLIKPLINLYQHLDEDYPRQKRLNKIFMALYIAKREALIEAFNNIGYPALQPLLNYRHKTAVPVTYSQARLDLFLQPYVSNKLEPIFGLAEPQYIPELLNRQKYSVLHKLRGASFEQETIRQSLLSLTKENQLPTTEAPILGLNNLHYSKIEKELPSDLTKLHYSSQLDEWLIHPDPVVRANLAWRLASIKSVQLLPLIFELMKDPNPEVRRYAAIAVGNFQTLDSQGAYDQKFIEIIRLLQNYRSNSDSFARGSAVLALTGTTDKQKTLYAIDLLLNDGEQANSTIGSNVNWRSSEEQTLIESWTETLQKNPEDLWVKTQALNALITLNSTESLDLLLHYLHRTYINQHRSPSFWRYIAPHFSLPQAAENAEDVILYLAESQLKNSSQINNLDLKALRMGLWRAYENRYSGEYFQTLNFLRHFDIEAYQVYLSENTEQIRIMRVIEYLESSYNFWIVAWLLCLIGILIINYSLLPLLNINLPAHNTPYKPNRRANPAADDRHQAAPPSAAIVPININPADH